MISKEERLQYGEILREQVRSDLNQMKEKERRKQLEQLEKRGVPRSLQPEPPQYIAQPVYQAPSPQPPSQYNAPPQLPYKQNYSSGGGQSPVLDKKELLQKKLEMQEYNPFGRAGAGAPMRDQRGEIIANRKPAISHPSNIANYAPYQHNEEYEQQGYAQPQQQMYVQQPQQYMHSQQNIPQGAMQYSGDNQPFSPPMQQIPQVMTYSQPIQQQQLLQQVVQSYHPSFAQQQAPPAPVQEVYRGGGRNLLQLENIGAEQISLKQRQKMEYQRVLQQQIDEAARRKKEAEQKEKRIEMQRQEEYKRYLEEEKKKDQAEKRKKQLEEENRLAALEKARQPAQQKKRKNFVEMPPIQSPQPQASPQVSSRPAVQPAPQQNYVVQRQHAPSPSLDPPEEEPIQDMEGAFNTDVSRDFLRKEKEKHPERQMRQRQLEKIKDQYNQIKQQLNFRSEQHNNELEKVRMEADRARLQKQAAEFELNKVKEELRRKMDEDNQKLGIALMKNDPSHYAPPQRVRAQPPEIKPSTPLRASSNEVLVEKSYRVQQENVNLSNTNNFDAGLHSLVAQSRKIPVLLKNNDKLTMSRIEEFAVDSRFFHKKSSNNVVQKRNEIIYEAEQDENNNAVPQEFKQQQQYRPKSKQQDIYANEFAGDGDQLDRLVRNQGNQSKEVGKWSKNMSSVDSQIGREIEQIMKDQRKAPSRGSQEQGNHSSTKLSTVGKNIVSDKYGYGAEEFTINSNDPGTIKGAYGTRNSFDLERINQRNDKRLQNLRGIGSVVSGDDELNRLDIMLNKYQQ